MVTSNIVQSSLMQQGGQEDIPTRLRRALALLQQGNRPAARQLCESVLNVDRGNADAWHILGHIARQDGRRDIAVHCFQQALAQQPKNVEIRNNLANTLKEMGRINEAIAEYQKALKDAPNDANLHSNLGGAWTSLRRWDDAKKCFLKALKLNAEYPEGWYNLAVIHSILGDKAEREKACRNAVKLRPHYGHPWHMIVQGKQWSKGDKDIEAIEQAFNGNQGALEDKIHLAFALGRIYEDLKAYDTAYAWLRKANNLKRNSFTFDIHPTENQLDWIPRLITKEWIEARRPDGHKDNAPIFILGLPRSGTSLVEQIIATHSDVHGAGELSFLRDMLHMQESQLQRPYPVTVANMDGKALAQLGAQYCKLLHALAPDAKRVVDKLPGNFPHAGLIAAMLPDAKIIRVRREIMDNGWAIYKRFFGDHLPYGYDLHEIGVIARQERMLYQHFEKALPKGVLLTVDYETLVKKPEKEIKRILEFLGLEWEPKCLEFHASKRPVITASADQVRQPIYDSSIGVARHYGQHLEQFKAALEGVN